VKDDIHTAALDALEDFDAADDSPGERIRTGRTAPPAAPLARRRVEEVIEKRNLDRSLQDLEDYVV
jgi:hypothetical protein